MCKILLSSILSFIILTSFNLSAQEAKLQKVEISDSILSSSGHYEMKKRIITEKAIKFDIAKKQSKTLNITMQTDDFKDSYKKLKKIIKKSKAIILSTNQNQYNRNKRINISLSTDKEGFAEIQSNINKLGFLESQNLVTNNKRNKNQLYEMELKHLIGKVLVYEAEFKKMDSDNPNYLSFLKTIETLNDRVFNLQKQLTQNTQITHKYIIHIVLHEKHSEPLSDSFRFVNMPGGEYNYLMIDTPKDGLSSKAYHGWGIKYMFSSGKSYVILNIMKARDNTESKEQVKEIFVYAYGADFYPRYLGSGKRMFLNLYSGFTIGGAYFTAEDNIIHTFQATAHLGLELIKTKRLLMDLKAGYFLPLEENRNLRGYLFTGSLNFMF